MIGITAVKLGEICDFPESIATGIVNGSMRPCDKVIESIIFRLRRYMSPRRCPAITQEDFVRPDGKTPTWIIGSDLKRHPYEEKRTATIKMNPASTEVIADVAHNTQDEAEPTETKFITGSSETDLIIQQLRHDEYLKIGFMTNYPALFPDKDFDKVLGDYCMQLYFFKQRITDYKHLFNSFRNFLNKKYQYQGYE